MDHKKQVPKDRHSNTGLQGLPKKGGGGGKGTWGKGGIDDLKQNNEDPHDPNYNSDDDEQVILEKRDGISPFEAVLREFLLSADFDEAIKTLQELNLADSYDQFVKKAIVTGMEKQSFERELISKMLSTFYNDVIPADKIADGFQLTLNSIDDLVLDTPDGGEILSKFLARAIVDEIVPPAFLKTATVKSPLADEVLATATGLTTEVLRLERLAHIWGAGDLSSVKRLKGEVDLMLKEFLLNKDKAESDKSLRTLNVPSFHFQVVKNAIRLGIQRGEEERKNISSLLASFSKSGLISQDHMEKGFRTCHSMIKDISLDVPNAPKLLEESIQLAQAESYLPKDFRV